MKFQEAQKAILTKLERELDPKLSYHSLDHTLYVMTACKELATWEKLSEEEEGLLLTAAAYHDAGFLSTYKDHETFSAQIAKDYLTKFDFSPEQIIQVQQMIEATRVPQQPRSKLDEIICDADLFYLGGFKYEEIAGGLIKELRAYGYQMDDAQWLKLQIDFLTDHQYFTEYCKTKKAPQKENNLNFLKSR